MVVGVLVGVALAGFVVGFVVKDVRRVGNPFFAIILGVLIVAVEFVFEKMGLGSIPAAVLVGLWAFIIGLLLPKLLRFVGVPIP